MSFNEAFYNREVNSLLNDCIRELRRYSCEEEPTNDYRFNKYILDSVNLRPFIELDEIIRDMVEENEILTVGDPGIAANVFIFMSYLSSIGEINNFVEEEDRYDSDGIKYAKKEKVCYPLISLLFAEKCDFYMLGSRLFPRIIIGGMDDIKRIISKWQKEFRISLPYNLDLEKFCDGLYFSFVPNPESLDSITTPYFSSKANKYLEIKNKYSNEEFENISSKRDDFLTWFKNMEALHIETSVDRSLSSNIW